MFLSMSVYQYVRFSYHFVNIQKYVFPHIKMSIRCCQYIEICFSYYQNVNTLYILSIYRICFSKCQYIVFQYVGKSYKICHSSMSIVIICILTKYVKGDSESYRHRQNEKFYNISPLSLLISLS